MKRLTLVFCLALLACAVYSVEPARGLGRRGGNNIVINQGGFGGSSAVIAGGGRSGFFGGRGGNTFVGTRTFGTVGAVGTAGYYGGYGNAAFVGVNRGFVGVNRGYYGGGYHVAPVLGAVGGYCAPQQVIYTPPAQVIAQPVIYQQPVITQPIYQQPVIQQPVYVQPQVQAAAPAVCSTCPQQVITPAPVSPAYGCNGGSAFQGVAPSYMPPAAPTSGHVAPAVGAAAVVSTGYHHGGALLAFANRHSVAVLPAASAYHSVRVVGGGGAVVAAPTAVVSAAPSNQAVVNVQTRSGLLGRKTQNVQVVAQQNPAGNSATVNVTGGRQGLLGRRR